MIRLRTLVVVTAMLVAPAACNRHDPAREADRAADRVNTKVDDLQDKTTDLTKTAREREKLGDLADQATHVGKAAHDLHDAQQDFRYQRAVRVAELRAEHAVIASQPSVINALATSRPTGEPERAKIAESLHVFQMRLDETGNAIVELDKVDAKTWNTRSDEVAKAMTRLNDARKHAWDALDDAERADRSSMP